MGGSPADGSLPASCDQRGDVGNAMGCAMRQKVGRSYIADAVLSFGCLGLLVACAARSAQSSGIPTFSPHPKRRWKRVLHRDPRVPRRLLKNLLDVRLVRLPGSRLFVLGGRKRGAIILVAVIGSRSRFCCVPQLIDNIPGRILHPCDRVRSTGARPHRGFQRLVKKEH
jgi:hypothetical protein